MQIEPVTTAEKIAEIKRELAMRHGFYAKQVKAGRMDGRLAARRIQIMNAMLADYEAQARPQADLFNGGGNP